MEDPDTISRPEMVPGTCLMTAVRDEGADILEWVAFHRLLGFERILVWSNDCTDGSDLLLDRLAEMGWIRHYRHSPPAGVSAQDNVMAEAMALPERAQAEWVMWLDADEFLVIHKGNGLLGDLVAALKGTDGLAVNWRVFGTMGRRSLPEGQLVTETLTRAAPLSDNFSRVVKTLYRNRPEIAALGIHRPLWQPGSKVRLRRSNGKLLQDLFLFQPKKNGRPRDMLGIGKQSWALAQVNHYAIKSLERLALKRARGRGLAAGANPDRFGSNYIGWFDRNEEEDRSLARHLPALRKLMAEALRDDRLAACHRTCLDLYRQRVARVTDWTDQLESEARLLRHTAPPAIDVDEA